MNGCREGSALLHGLCSESEEGGLVAFYPDPVAKDPLWGMWQMKADLRGLQNAQSLCPSCDVREPWLSERESSYLLLLTLLEFASSTTHLPLLQCGLAWQPGHKHDTHLGKGGSSLAVCVGSTL